MTTRKGSQKRQAQRYQNKTAFKIKYDEQGIKMQANAPLDHLCDRCVQQIKWKLQYNKYKRQTNVSRCTKCQQKNIIKSYRTICDKCSNELKLCAKCQTEQKQNPEQDQKEKPGVENDLLIMMKKYLAQFKERSRRKIMRLIKQKKATWNRKQNCFVEIDTQKEVEDLQIKNAFNNDEFKENDENDEDDEEFEEDKQNDFNQNKESNEKSVQNQINNQENQVQDNQKVVTSKTKNNQQAKDSIKQTHPNKNQDKNDSENNNQLENGNGNNDDDADDDDVDINDLDEDLEEMADQLVQKDEEVKSSENK